MAFGNFGPVMWLFLSAAAIFSSGTSTKRDLVLHEERRSLPCGWEKGARLDPDIIHPVRIGLLHNQLDKGDELVMSVSDPESPKYGQYWTQEQVHSFFSPSEESVTKVLQWLKESIPASDLASSIKQSENNAWLEFSASIQRIEELLGTEFYAYRHESGHTVASAEAYHLPASIQKHIDLVWPGIHLPPKRDTSTKLLQKRDAPDPSPPTQQVPPMAVVLDSTSDGKEPCSNHTYLNPECIRYLYGIPPGFAPSIPSYRHGIYASGNDHYNPSDLDVFWSNFAPEVPKDAKSTVEEVLNDGAATTINTSRTWGGELYMNVALTVPLLYPNKISIISSDDPIVQANHTLTGAFTSLLDAFDGSYCTYSAFNTTGSTPDFDPEYPNPAQGGYKGKQQCGGLTPPPVLFSPWGATEDFYPISYQRRQCAEFMKLALQGVTVLISSGDGGIAGNTDTCWGPKEDHWTVSAPGSCPYVTAVGGTKLKPGVDILHPSENPELGYVASAGGISAIFERPKWQESFVTEYLETASIAAPGFTELAPLVANDTVLADLLPDLGNGLRSLSGRGLPDISALASISSTYVIDEGVVYPVGGTSVSALYVGAIISRINLERLAIGKPVVGFINPVLYKYADTIVRDITGGDDNGRCNQTGYPTTVGWDAVTGLGVLKYKEALDLWLSL